MSAVTFTTDQVIKGISNCSNTKAFGPDKLSIFHIKNLGPKAIEYLTALFNDSVTSCRIPAIWKSSIVIPIPKPTMILCKNFISANLTTLPGSESYGGSHVYHCQPTHTSSPLLTNTNSDPDTQPLLLYYNSRLMSRQPSIKGNRHIKRSVSL